MIVVDHSAIPLPGRQEDAIAALKDPVADLDAHWPAATPRQILVQTTGETGRLHLIATWESLTAYERRLADGREDAQRSALAQKLVECLLPGSLRTTHF